MADTVWTCKIGSLGNVPLPRGADGPMRDAVSDAYHKLTGQDRQFLFSGWGGDLTPVERAIVENKPLPCPPTVGDWDAVRRVTAWIRWKGEYGLDARAATLVEWADKLTAALPELPCKPA